MALEGNLETFGISEIFQLVSQQGKTGTLEIQTDDGTARVRFAEGRLVEAWPDRRSPSELIGVLAVRAGLITQAQLDHALELQRQSLRPLGDILIRSGALRIAEFQAILNLQHRETVYRFLLLRRGKFHFRAEAVSLEEGISVPMEVGTLLMEGFRQVDEWPRLRERIPSENRVFEPTGSTSEVLPQDAPVLDLVDGAATVRQVVDRARLGEFAGWDALTRLLDAGAIRPAEVVKRLAPERRVGPSLTPAVVDAAVAAVLLGLAAFALASWQGGGQAARLGSAVAEAGRQARDLEETARVWSSAEPAAGPGRGRP